MAVLSPTKVDSIKTALANPQKVSDATVEAVRQFLFPATSETAKEPSTGLKDDKKRSVNGSRVTKGKSSKKAPSAATTSNGTKTDLKTAHSKLCLATDVSNATLKILSDELKMQRKFSDSSANFRAREPCANVILIATCAHFALAYLGGHEAETGDQAPTLQVDNGILSLLDKCIGLSANGEELTRLAYKQLHILKSRLDCHLANEASTSQATKEKADSDVPFDPQRVPELFRFNHKPVTSTIRSLVVSYQFAALRFLHRLGDKTAIEEAMPHLWIGELCSPTSLMEEQAAQDNLREKTALQIDKLSGILFSIASAHVSVLNVSTVAKLKAIALQARVLRWFIVKHHPDIEKELWVPLAKVYEFLSRSSDTDYDIWQTFYDQLSARLLNEGYLCLAASRRGIEDGHTDVMDNLIAIARSGARYEDAFNLMDARYYNVVGAAGTSDISDAKMLFLTVRFAQLFLGGNVQNPKRLNILKLAAERLDGNIKGSTEDLFRLFSEVSLLQKAASQCYLENSSSENAGTSGHEDTESYDEALICGTIVFSSMKFVLRFISKSDQANTQTKGTYAKRTSVASKIAKTFINSVLLCCKKHITIGDIEFHHLDAALQDTVAVASQLEITGVNIRISNLYWFFAKSSANNCDTSEGAKVKAVRRSIEVLSCTSIEEKSGGQYSMKLEYMAGIYASAKNITRAWDYLTNSAQHQIEAGVLKTAATLASTTSLRAIPPSEDSFRFQQTLREMQQLLLKAKETDQLSFFDDAELSDDERGILLELQLQLMLDSCLSSQIGRKTKPLVLALVRTLLSVYTFENFPIRRTRVIVTYLRACPSDMTPIDNSLPTEFISSRRISNPGKDEGLRRYASYLIATLRIHKALCCTPADLADLKDALCEWQRIVDSARSSSDLEAQVDDVEDWKCGLSYVAEFLETQDLARLLIPTRSLLESIYHLKGGSDPGAILNLSNLATVWARNGYSDKARACLDKAKIFLSDEVLADVRLDYYLAFAEQSILAYKFEECWKAIQDAKALAETIPELSEGLGMTLSFPKRLRYTRMIADACYVSAQYYFADNSKTREALAFAREAVKLNQKAWANLENRKNPKPLDVRPDSDTDIDAAQIVNGEASTREEFQKLTLAPNAPTSPELWKIVGPMIRSYTLLSKIYAHNGLIQEALFYADSARGIAISVSSPSQIWRTKCHCHALRLAAGKFDGKFDEAMALLKEIDDEVKSHDDLNPLDRLHYGWTKALHFRAMGAAGFALPPEEEKKVYEDALREIEDCARNVPAERFEATELGEELAEKLDRLNIVEGEESAKGGKKVAKSSGVLKKTKTKTKATSRTGKTKVDPDTAKTASKPKPTAKAATTQNSNCTNSAGKPQPTTICSPFCYDVLLGYALAVALPESTDSVDELLETTPFSLNCNDVLKAIWVCRVQLEHVLSQLVASPAFSTFADSVIALPAIALNKLQLVEDNDSNTDAPSQEGSIRGPSRSKLSRKKVNETVEATDDFVAPLFDARHHLVRGLHQAIMSSSTHVLHRFFGVGSDMGMVLSVLTQKLPGPKTHPLSHALGFDYPREFAFQKELAVIHAEIEKIDRSRILAWPTYVENVRTQPSALDVPEFQQQYIDILPPTWTAISMTLSHDKDKLNICRYRSGETPFILSLPMARSSPMDPNEEEFSFQTAKTELMNIIELSNYSAHEAKNITTSAAKSQWWDARRALDDRLRDLLVNMEKSWIGGFRSIFAQQLKHPQLLANFQRALQVSLNRHLPSRRGQSSIMPVQFDPRVLELFTGLGDPNENGVDLDDALLDLLYFVVDILKFNGEPNAYDEVDFDSLVIETADALKIYHSSIQASADPSNHTILILDKQLHIFPWESLPSLSTLAISRLPSILHLRSRVLAARDTKHLSKSDLTLHNTHGYFISRSHGNSILNPSGDLKSTEATIYPLLHSLPSDRNGCGSWTHSSDLPTESKLINLLPKSNIFLYFGHGSGAQYIRPRAVRKLLFAGDENSGTPTTWLMGCSSAAVTTNGEFEPSGMVLSYLASGSPAVVGTLWDVTDKDTDRASVKMGEVWGLWEKQVREDLKAKKRKGRGKGKDQDVEMPRRAGRARADRCAIPQYDGALDETEDEVAVRREGKGEKASLVQAVTRSRDECYLRYLNGAALVVYGVPVYLVD